ncbi:MAG: glycosyltransferase family 4 protein [Patulibacter sp.]|nr:glycosyltransferase family 4 protein [Patulibacter sp.]
MSRCLRIGLVYDDTIDRFGGIGLYVTTLGRALVRRGHHVEYLLGTSSQRAVDGSPVRSLARNVEVRFNGNLLSMPAWSPTSALRKTLTTGRFDVLHVQVPYSPLMAGRLIRACDDRCAVVGTHHVASSRFAPRIGARLLRTLCASTDERFDRMLAVSQTAREFAMTWSNLGVDEVVPNLLDVAHLRGQAALKCTLPAAELVFVGRLVPRKGVADLLRALHVMREISPTSPPRVAIVGDGPLRARLERLTLSLNLNGSVTFHGAIGDAEKASLLSRAQIACFPSLFGESFGVVVLEALASGSEAVLAGDNPGYRELLADPAALVDPTDPYEFARRLVGLLADAPGRRSLGSRQRDLLLACSVDSVTDQIERAYSIALARRRGAGWADLGRPKVPHAVA